MINAQKRMIDMERLWMTPNFAKLQYRDPMVRIDLGSRFDFVLNV